jgi:hypothetical protein
MKERCYTLCYIVLGAGAAFAATAILLPCREIFSFPACNLFITMFIYYNRMALNDPTQEEETSLAGPFLVI